MPGRSYRIGRIAGIPVGVSPWWLVIVVFFTWVLGADYFPEVIHGIAPAAAYGLGLASVLLLFASILAHEFGHAIVARHHGIEVEEIDLWLLGGVSKMTGEAHEPGDELRYAVAGPLITLVIAICFELIALALPSSTPASVAALVEYQVYVNALIFVFNMLPAFPLDGGRVLRALLWRRRGDLGSSTATAASVGRGFGYVTIALGGLELLSGEIAGLWLAVIGFFVVMASGQQALGAQVRVALSGVHAHELMSSPVVCIPAELSAAQAGADFFLRYRYTAFPVVDGSGRALGLVALRRIESLPAAERTRRTVGELAERDPALLVDPDEDVATLLARPAFVRVGRAVVVDGLNQPVGLLSITDVQRRLRAAQLGQPARRGGVRAAA